MSAFYIIALTACLHMAASAQVNTTTLDKKIGIVQQTIRIDSLLKVFSRQTGIEFSFNPGKVRPSQTVAVPGREQTLSQWLTTLRQKLGIQHKVVGNHIILFGSNSAAPTRTTQRTKSATATPVRKTAPDIPAPPTKIIIITDSSQQPLPASTPAPTPDVQLPTPTVHTPAGDSAQRPPTPQKPGKAEQPKKTAVVARPSIRQAAHPEKEQSPTSDHELPREAIQALLGFSHHGSGDMKGISFGAEYTWYLSHKFSLNINLLGTIHHSRHYYSYTHPTSQTTTDTEVRFTTGGAQLGINAQLSVLRSLHHEILFSLGGFGRYQSASPDSYSMYPPQATGYPEFLFSLYSFEPHNTFSPGVLLQFHYNFTFNNNMILGLKTGIQTDTNGDLIPQAGLTIGKRF